MFAPSAIDAALPAKLKPTPPCSPPPSNTARPHKQKLISVSENISCSNTAASETQHPSALKQETGTAEVDKLLRKVRSLEQTIAFLTTHHSVSIRGLHDEIRRLQDACNDAVYGKIVKDEPVPCALNDGTSSKVEEVNHLEKELQTARSALAASKQEITKREETIRGLILDIKQYERRLAGVALERDEKKVEVEMLKQKIEEMSLNMKQDQTRQELFQSENSVVAETNFKPFKEKDENVKLEKVSMMPKRSLMAFLKPDLKKSQPIPPIPSQPQHKQ